MSLFLAPKETILFQGDSITDGGRNRLNKYDLGIGYPELIAMTMEEKFPHHDITYYNKAVWGDEVVNLTRRWKRDCLKLTPTIVSILVGINETKNLFELDHKTTLLDFQISYRYLLMEIKNTLPNTKIILMSPFLLPTTSDKFKWYEDLNPKIKIIENLAREFNTEYIPLDKIFIYALSQKNDPYYWTEDGVYPTPAGHALIAKYWLKIFNL